MKDEMGDRLKAYEEVETSKCLDKSLPVYARIDGRGFSKFTRGMNSPYDEAMSSIMITTTAELVNQTNALMGYTQSDEISLVWNLNENPEGELFFAGKVQKLASVLASLTTSIFINQLIAHNMSGYVKKTPHFDCRVFNVPSEIEVANAFLWREKDASRNSVSMAGRDIFSHKELQGKSTREMKEMLLEVGVDLEDYPANFKRGTFLQKRKVLVEITDDVWNRIPEVKRPQNRNVFRSDVHELDMPPFVTVKNREDVIFRATKPIT